MTTAQVGIGSFWQEAEVTATITRVKYQAPRGTEDLLPGKSEIWVWLESQFREVCGLFGYQEVRTPTFEDTELFVRGLGEGTDVVSKETYTFLDRGGRSITLKPEGTAGAVRAYLENNLGASGQICRLYYITPVFRYERPQKGRLRESHQVGVELLGSPSPEADFEVIDLTRRWYESIGLAGISIKLNSLGMEKCRSDYRNALLEFARPLLVDLGEEFKAKCERNPLRLLDSKDEKLRTALMDAPLLPDFWEDETRIHQERLQELLNLMKIRFELDPRLVRGLDYYTKTVFEVHSDQIGSQSALCGGGRYDGLVKECGGPETAAVGVAMGMERAHMALEAINRLPKIENKNLCFAICLSENKSKFLEIVSQLRDSKLNVLLDNNFKSAKSQFRQADSCGARFALIIGDEEILSNQVKIKDLMSGEEAMYSTEVVASVILDAQAPSV